MRSIFRHLPHYLTLFGILFAGLLGIFIFSYDRVSQVIISIAVAVAYVAWGVVHHTLHKDFHLAVVVEYLLVAGLGLVVVFSLIFRS